MKGDAMTSSDKYQVMPPLSDEEYQALKSDIANNGVIVPVEYDEDGNVLDGFHRVKACRELGIDDWPSFIRRGLTEEEKRTHARRLNIVRRHLTRAQKREQVKAQLRDTPGWSNNRIAQMLGTTDKTVKAVRVELETTSEIPKFDTRKGADGIERPAEMPRPEPQEASPQPALEGIFTPTAEAKEKADGVVAAAKKDSPVGDKAREEADKLAKGETTAKTAAKQVEAAKAGQAMDATVFSHESKEYYTPADYIEAAREVMGAIDLDPASCETAQGWIRAGTFYTEQDDGLVQEWFGRVWLNPPYSKTGGKSNQETWAQRLIEEYEANNVTEGILLVKAALGYNWFEAIWPNWPVCFARERISFIRPSGEDKGQSKMASAFVYFGDNLARFAEVFKRFGRVIPSQRMIDETLYKSER